MPDSIRKYIKRVTTELADIVCDFAAALKAADSSRPIDNPKYKPGIGPHREDVAIALALTLMKLGKPERYGTAVTGQCYPEKSTKCDLVLPTEWAIELKLVRPFYDNGTEDQYWVKNLLYPYAGHESAAGDAVKVRDSAFTTKTAVLIFGFEHMPAKIDLEPAITAFELIAREILGVCLGDRQHSRQIDLVHPVHRQLRVDGWEVLRD